MEGRNIKIVLIFFAAVQPFVVSIEKRKVTCGFINNENGEDESEAMQLAATQSNADNNVSITLKILNVSTTTSLFDEAVSTFRQQNVIALIGGSHSKASACALSTVTGIPLVRLHGDNRQLGQCEKAVDMSAEYRYLAHATLDILNKFKWKKISLIFDESRSIEAGYFYVTYKKLQLTMNLIQLSKHNKNEEIKRTILRSMKQIQTFQPEVILLYTNNENTELILQQEPCQPNIPYRWILQQQVSSNVKSLPNNVVLAFELPHMNGSTVDHIKTEAHQERLIFSDKGLTVALAYDAIQVINQALHKEVCSSLNGSSSLPADRDVMFNCMKKVKFKGLTGPVQFDESGKRTEIALDVLNLRNNSFQRIGTWNSTKHAVLFEDPLPNALSDSSLTGELEGRKFRIVYVEEPPFVTTKKNADGTFFHEGYCIDLLNELARILKFTYEMYPSPDGHYGATNENGTWDGMMQELIDGVWFATLASLGVISVAVFVINYFSPYGYKDDNGRGTSEEFSFFNSVWFALACMLQQGGDNTPRNLSGRILTGCYWFCILIWVSTYTANLAAFLTVKNAAQSINNLDDIVSSSHQVGIIASTSTAESFKTSQYPPHKKIWNRIQADNTFVKNTSQGIKWVREREGFVFLTDGPILRHIANQRPCDLTVVPGLTTAKGLTLAFQAHDPHTNDFTLAILRLFENDFLDSLRRKWWENSNACAKEQETTLSRKRIDLLSMLGVYVVLGVGIVVALLALIAEIYWKRTGNKVRAMTRRPKNAVEGLRSATS
ncbi:glutamate receptor ionotropic, kainate 3-like isoform X2 [Oculina patagonica]